MYQKLNKQRQLNDMRLRQNELKELLKEAPNGSELQRGLQEESLELSRLIPLVDKHVTNVDVSAEHQAKEVKDALEKEATVKEQTAKLLMTLNSKRNKLERDKADAESERIRLERETVQFAHDPEALAEARGKLARHEAKVTRLEQMRSALDFNQANAISIVRGDAQLKVTDPKAMADIASRKRAVAAAKEGTVAHDLALESLEAEQLKAKNSFLAEVDSYEQ
ncbi:hypothetical protein ACPV5U_18525 [Vibrio mediterranei]